MRALGLLVVLVCGCSDGPGTQYLPIGSSCSRSEQCGTLPFACAVDGYPGGYCERGCATDGDCPGDSVCAAAHCRRSCQLRTQCRSDQGYDCLAVGATVNVCVPAAGGMDGGAGT